MWRPSDGDRLNLSRSDHPVKQVVQLEHVFGVILVVNLEEITSSAETSADGLDRLSSEGASHIANPSARLDGRPISIPSAEHRRPSPSSTFALETDRHHDHTRPSKRNHKTL